MHINIALPYLINHTIHTRQNLTVLRQIQFFKFFRNEYSLWTIL